MARSIFKRVIKMGIKEVRKSIAALAMGNPFEKVNFNTSNPLNPVGAGEGIATT